ncbi:uncharacterized protein LOC114337513 isoform X3 [Diabrotica virgifera virgifera]|uniref:Uncharacterized protein n=1 Tax=Diabrotica virgifera virgifera TaxID=50390 RepID=A0ABM5JLY6_DIAVI|nr:uncharacterized protein LOC114337513 isoform X3 [Diabrotica virgifera virgifera]
MEVVAATPGGAPFHDHDVREWSRIDSITGALERARLETDHWSANTINSSHKYGKVVDSRARTDADGALHQSARRQLEVFSSEIPGGRLQVIKTHTVSSSKWSSSGSSKDFENLQLSINPLDLSSQKSKASVGRTAVRRPPTRQRTKEPLQPSSDLTDHLRNAHITAATNLHRVSRLCHQIHESAVRQAFGRRSPRPTISDRESGDGGVEIYEIESVSSENNNSNSNTVNGHTNLVRTKSSSSDDISLIPEKDTNGNKSIEDLEDLEQLQTWRRTSKIRRSLQFPKQASKPSSPKPVDLPESLGNVRKIREELEKGRRLNTALRNNSVDLDALDQILQSISSSSSDKASEDLDLELSKKQKRNSFVTVESIQEIKGRLRKTSSPTNDIYKVNGKDDDPDDGIVTEETSPIKENEMPLVENSRVRSYVYGMEALLNKKPGIGTGSLESRVKLIPTNKNEDWYNRRKSYGFEKVHNHNDSQSSISLKNKNFVESSTDSGICRSTEIVVPVKKNGFKENEFSSDEQNDLEQKYNEYDNNSKHQLGQVKRIASSFNQEDSSPTNKNENWKKSHFDWSNSPTELKSTTITIPISKNNNIVDLSWNDTDREQLKDIKRHSIAVDESKYVTRNNNNNSFRRISLALNDQVRPDDDDNNMRKTKKVEFCKTEVHFAAESGKVNIVATDEKPPPTQNFRRRRRNSGSTMEDFNKNGLPLLHFGDTTFEKPLFSNSEDSPTDSLYENLQSRISTNYGLVTVNSNNAITTDISEEDKKELTESEIKGILKNKPNKPKPYHLGETVPFGENMSDEDSKWGVRLRHIEKPEVPIWKSTVTVHNYNFVNQEKENEPEFQKLLKNLRPTRQTDYTSDSEMKYFDGHNITNINNSINGRAPSWPSPEKLEPSKEVKGMEIKGYSTKICLREGEAMVVESDGYEREKPSIRPRIENLRKDSLERLRQPEVMPQTTKTQEISRKQSTVNIIRSHLSPNPVRRTPISRPDLRPSEQLSSPSIVNKNKSVEVTKMTEKRSIENSNSNLENRKVYPKPADGIVLRTPKKSEMTYFGVNVSPKPVKKVSQAVIRKENRLLEKPDLIQHHKKSPSPIRKPYKSPSPIRKVHKSPSPVRRNQKSPSPTRNGRKSPTKNVSEPIYENIKNKYGREFDSSILEELTKAADQILQAVNGYTDEEVHNRLSSDDEDNSHKNRLETILETKSMHQKSSTTRQKVSNVKTKLNPTSPTSSIESLNRKKGTSEPKTKPCYEKHRRRTERVEKTEKIEKVEQTSTKAANTRARRLQRASSREALLRSNGSSSEDLPTKIEPPRKPRLIKKTKTTQLSMSNGIEMKKHPNTNVGRRKEDSGSKNGEERILNSLPEIRHKTAISTIRSTSEKTARDRLKHKTEDVKRKTPQKRETVKSVTPSSRSEREKSSKQSPSLHKETVTHRISTAYVPVCRNRSRNMHARQQDTDCPCLCS